MNSKIKDVVKEQIEKIKPDKEIQGILEEETKKIINFLKNKIKKKNIKADIFLGGSFAKETIIKKDKYDIDIYVRFQHDNKSISDTIAVILGNKAERIHGSRDYFKLNKGKVSWEIIPILRINAAEKAKNITDLSPFHVSYVKNCVKKNKLGDEIRLAKAFCYSQNVYGAESYIRGLSGYAVELLVCYYKGFLQLVKAAAKSKDRIILDPEKFYKNKQEILENLNEAKLQSPIILVDPTYKSRNALAALSQETFIKFKETCIKFLEKPSEKFFEKKEFDEKSFRKIKGEFAMLEIKTNKQAGDIAGSKLLKFAKLLENEASKYFEIKSKYFEYNDAQAAFLYLIIKKKQDRIISGPPICHLLNLTKFKSAHKSVFIKQGRSFAREKISFNFQGFLKRYIEKNKISIKSMGITGLKLK